MPSYNEYFHLADQVDMEERIAVYLFDHSEEIGEGEAAQAGRDILLMVLAKFRPDLIDD